MSDPRITNEVRKAARDAALHRWGTGSADTTQMLLSVDAALEAALPHLTSTREQIAEALHAHDQKRALIPLAWAQASYMTRHAYLSYADAVQALPHLTDDGAAAPPAAPHTKPAATGGEQSAESATTTAAPSSPNPVTREAVESVVLDEFAGQGGLGLRVLEDGARRIASAVLALLNGGGSNG